MDIDTATPRQLVCGLMRGNASELKLGYSAVAATKTVGEIKQLTSAELNDLCIFAEGFAIGINEDTSDLLPAVVES